MPSNCVAMVGRVLDKTGRPITGSNVHLRARRHPWPIERAEEEWLVAFDGGFVLVTDTDGRFRTPRELEPDRQYVAYASAEGYQYNRTGLTLAGSRSFPDLTLQPVSRTGGTFDGTGRPVARLADRASALNDRRSFYK